MLYRKARILIVDDEKDLLFFLKENLEARGNYEVFTASSGRKGLFLAYWKKPDIILLDIMMPGMDGFEVLKRIKESPKTTAIPVIMLTAKQDDDSKARAAGLYNEDYITKPVEIHDLKVRIDLVLSQKR